MRKGVGEPYVRRATQITQNWVRMATEEWINQYEVREYWGKLEQAGTHVKGPIHQMARLLQELGIETEGPRRWKVNDRFQDIGDIVDLKEQIRQKAVDGMWGKLSRTRHNFKGLEL